MPRQARIDFPGALHHVMARGVERRLIFFDDADRRAFADAGGTPEECLVEALVGWR